MINNYTLPHKHDIKPVDDDKDNNNEDDFLIYVIFGMLRHQLS